MALSFLEKKIILEGLDKGLLEVKPRISEEAEEIKKLKEERKKKEKKK